MQSGVSFNLPVVKAQIEKANLMVSHVYNIGGQRV
jgi:hypothetical protein